MPQNLSGVLAVHVFDYEEEVDVNIALQMHAPIKIMILHGSAPTAPAVPAAPATPVTRRLSEKGLAGILTNARKGA